MFRFFQSLCKNDPFNQIRIIRTYNLLVDRLTHHLVGIPQKNKLTKLNSQGVCSGLDQHYIAYARAHRHQEFFDYLQFIYSLKNVNQIEALAKRYKECKLQGKKLWVTSEEKGNPIDFDKLLSFFEGVSLAQFDQFKEIGMVLDRSVSFIAKDDCLLSLLKAARITDGDFIRLGIGSHSFCLEKTPAGFNLFDSNLIEKPIPLTLENVAKTIIRNITGFRTCDDMLLTGAIGMRIVVLSLTEQPKFVAILDDIQNLTNQFPAFPKLIQNFHCGKISRADLVLMLRDELCVIEKKLITDQLINLKNKLQDYIQEQNFDAYEKFMDSVIQQNHSLLNYRVYNRRTTWLILAAMSNQILFTRKLLNAGADPNLGTEETFPLAYAATVGCMEIVKQLLDAGALVDKAPSNHLTSLYMASRNGHTEIVDMLLAKDADPNIVGSNNLTPLSIAAYFFLDKCKLYPRSCQFYNPYLEIIQLLLQHGADIDLAVLKIEQTDLSVEIQSACIKTLRQQEAIFSDAQEKVNTASLRVN